MRSRINQQLKLPQSLTCVMDPRYLLLEIRFNTDKCFKCNEEIKTLPYISKRNGARKIYHIKCAYYTNLLTDRQFFIIGKLPIIELKMEVLETEYHYKESDNQI